MRVSALSDMGHTTELGSTYGDCHYLANAPRTRDHDTIINQMMRVGTKYGLCNSQIKVVVYIRSNLRQFVPRTPLDTHRYNSKCKSERHPIT